jgi:hypothetical protein
MLQRTMTGDDGKVRRAILFNKKCDRGDENSRCSTPRRTRISPRKSPQKSANSMYLLD